MFFPPNSEPFICLSLRFLLPALYVSDESNLKMNSVDHIPQTFASHILLPEDVRSQGLEGGGIMQHGADMLKPDPRDTFYSSKYIVVFFCPIVLPIIYLPLIAAVLFDRLPAL